MSMDVFEQQQPVHQHQQAYGYQVLAAQGQRAVRPGPEVGVPHGKRRHPVPLPPHELPVARLIIGQAGHRNNQQRPRREHQP